MPFILKITTALFFLFSLTLLGQDGFPIKEYYPITDQNEWRYTAPDGWKDGDYISKIEELPNGFSSLFDAIEGVEGNDLFQVSKNAKTFRHYDATKASKLLSVDAAGITYHGETFASDGSIAVFDKPFLWFSYKKENRLIKLERRYIRYFVDGSQQKGVFTIQQEITKKEDVEVPAGIFKDCLRVEFDTYWDLGKGMEAKSENLYHHAKNLGVVKASARFIILKNGVEIINRLVEPDLKSYQLY